jgi:UDP-N-acetylglucosamine 2-epimerase (non-hydrolysing)
MKKILFVFGTRPEAIKLAPLVKYLEKLPELYELKVCITAQHRQMLDQVMTIFEIKPDFDLDLMRPGQDLYDITNKCLLGLKKIIFENKPDLLLVHGDTTTTLAASLAAFYQQVPVGHVEAGLRTHDIYSPWPEEMNRQLTSRIAQLHFAPTERAKQNLLRENISAENVSITGNTAIDALHWVLAQHPEPVKPRQKIVLITAHRRENFGDGISSICQAIKELALNNPEVIFIYPVHLNPNIQRPVYQSLSNIQNIELSEPLDYLPFIKLMQKSYMILTDSGGIQEEAPSLGKPVIVLRDTTERPEAVEAGTVCLVGANTGKIIEMTQKLLDDKDFYRTMSFAHNPYGDGKACHHIESFINKYFEARKQ